VSVLLDKPEPGLRHRIDQSLQGKPVRLLRIYPYYPGMGGTPAVPETPLQELRPEEVFLRRYRQQYAAEPSPELLAAFYELLEDLQGEEA
jgi:exonuclease SbcD